MSIENQIAAASKRAHLKDNHIQMNLMRQECEGMLRTPGLAGALDGPIVENKKRPVSLEFLVLLFQDKSTDRKKNHLFVSQEGSLTIRTSSQCFVTIFAKEAKNPPKQNL